MNIVHNKHIETTHTERQEMNIKNIIRLAKKHGGRHSWIENGNHCFASIAQGVETEDGERVIDVDICKGKCTTTESGLKVWEEVEVFIFDLDGNEIDHWID